MALHWALSSLLDTQAPAPKGSRHTAKGGAGGTAWNVLSISAAAPRGPAVGGPRQTTLPGPCDRGSSRAPFVETDISSLTSWAPGMGWGSCAFVLDVSLPDTVAGSAQHGPRGQAI